MRWSASCSPRSSYYGLADGTDLRAIRWSRGAYDVPGLDSLYTGNDRRSLPSSMPRSTSRDSLKDLGNGFRYDALCRWRREEYESKQNDFSQNTPI